MVTSYSPSVNIIRDSGKELNYTVTANAEKIAFQLINEFTTGFHSFTIIGSYGTGKSSFLWALQESLSKRKRLFDVALPKQIETVSFCSIVGEYQSMEEVFYALFEIDTSEKGHTALFKAILKKWSGINNGNELLVIAIDEFGKFLEYAAKNNPEKEMYFIQQFAEFANDASKNILFVTTLHQSIDAYSYDLSTSQKNEWKKINGRLKELAFNEPVEQLLALAADHFQSSFGKQSETDYTRSLISLQTENHIFGTKGELFKQLGNTLYPLDIFSGYMLTLALQRYGQNERSLFSFLQSSESLGLSELKDGDLFSIPRVFDYLYLNFYSLLNSRNNPDFAHWFSIKKALEFSEAVLDKHQSTAAEIIKTIGLFQIFGNKGATIDDTFFTTYFSSKKGETKAVVEQLTKRQIIRFNRFDQSYRIFDGSDFDIDSALLKAENQIERSTEIVTKLQAQFEFGVEQAKAIAYKTGTPRFFEYVLSSKPIHKIPVNEIDGFLNLIFSKDLSEKDLLETSQKEQEAIVYILFKHTEEIEQILFEIDKVNHVLKSISDDGDRVAINELESIRAAYQENLSAQVQQALLTDRVSWVFNGNKHNIHSRREMSVLLSNTCETVYPKTPRISNELINRHKVSGSIAGSRKLFFEALVEKYELEDLGFAKEKFPAEKTIYISLLKRTGIHIQRGDSYTLTRLANDSELTILWDACEAFLTSAKEERKPISELIETLTKRPYKIKMGVIDFWVPLFLFIRRGDYALYSEGNFKPYINKDELYLITRKPELYFVKSFELNELRLTFFNKYREYLHQQGSENITINSFIESIRPILLMYRDLLPYSKTTNRISLEAQRLREAISRAQDLEKVFFDDFPAALGIDVNELLKNDHHFDDYIFRFQETITEIKESYNQLLNRFEGFIQQEILFENLSFEKYKAVFKQRFASLKEHQLLPQQKTFLQRINSPLNDRDSWLASIGQTLIGKPLTQLLDTEEEVLKAKCKHLLKELDNLTEIEKKSVDSTKEIVFKIDFTSHNSGTLPHVVRIPKSQLTGLETNLQQIDTALGSDKQTRIALLAKLLNDELNS